MSRVHWLIYGGVQGVGFRFFTTRAARHAGIRAGWVRNRPDGAVEVEAEGTSDALSTLREHLASGPPHAAVERLEELPPGTDPLPAPFTIRH